MQQTKTALCNFNIFLSHNGLLPYEGLLPVITARFWLLMAGVRPLIAYKQKGKRMNVYRSVIVRAFGWFVIYGALFPMQTRALSPCEEPFEKNGRFANYQLAQDFNFDGIPDDVVIDYPEIDWATYDPDHPKYVNCRIMQDSRPLVTFPIAEAPNGVVDMQSWTVADSANILALKVCRSARTTYMNCSCTLHFFLILQGMQVKPLITVYAGQEDSYQGENDGMVTLRYIDTQDEQYFVLHQEQWVTKFGTIMRNGKEGMDVISQDRRQVMYELVFERTYHELIERNRREESTSCAYDEDGRVHGDCEE